MATKRPQQLKLTTTGISTFITGGTAGSNLYWPMIFKAVGATAVDGVLKIYINNGSTRTLIKELYIPIIPATTTVPAWEAVFCEPTLFLTSNTWLIEVEMSVDVGAIDCTTVVEDL